MKPELQNKLFEAYPNIFRQKDLPMRQTCMCWGIDTGDGWYNILDTLCNQIQNHLEHNLRKDQDPAVVNVEATQVKEKFGGLRFYYNGGDEFIEGLVWMAEAISGRACEECGSPGTQTTWVGFVHNVILVGRPMKRRQKMSENTNFTLQVIDIVDNPDGSATINFDVSDEFIVWFKEDQGLKRWSQKRFQKWAIEGIENYISLQEGDVVKAP